MHLLPITTMTSAVFTRCNTAIPDEAVNYSMPDVTHLIPRNVLEELPIEAKQASSWPIKQEVEDLVKPPKKDAINLLVGGTNE